MLLRAQTAHTLHPAAEHIFRRSSRPPQHFEQFMQRLMEVLGCSERPVSYACKLCYDLALRSIGELKQQLEDERTQIKMMEIESEQVVVPSNTTSLAELTVQAYAVEKRGEELESRHRIEEKRILELYDLRNDYSDLKSKYDEALLRVEAQHSEIAKMQEFIDSVNVQNVDLQQQTAAMRLKLDECESDTHRLLASQQQEAQCLISSIQAKLKAQTIALDAMTFKADEETRELSEEYDEIARLTTNLNDSYAENEAWRRRLHFEKLEEQTQDAADLSLAYAKISGELKEMKQQENKTVEFYEQRIAELSMQVVDLQQKAENSELALQKEEVQHQIDTRELERKIAVVEGEKDVLYQNAEEQLKEAEIKYWSVLEDYRAQHKLETDPAQSNLPDVFRTQQDSSVFDSIYTPEPAQGVDNANDELTKRLVGMLWSLCKVAKIDTRGLDVDSAVKRVLEFLSDL